MIINFNFFFFILSSWILFFFAYFCILLHSLLHACILELPLKIPYCKNNSFREALHRVILSPARRKPGFPGVVLEPERSQVMFLQLSECLCAWMCGWVCCSLPTLLKVISHCIKKANFNIGHCIGPIFHLDSKN